MRLKVRERLGLFLGGPQLLLKMASQALPFLPSSKSGKPIWNNWSTDNAIRDGLKASAWVYACVRRLATDASSVPWQVQQRGKGGQWELVPGHPLEILLRKPNTHMSGQDLMERLTHHLYLGGNGIWHIVGAGRVPAELWPIMPDKVKPIPHKRDWLEGYEYDTGEGKMKLKPEEIVHFQFVDPANAYWGLSPLQAAARVVDTDVEAVKWNKVSLQNRAITDGVFTFDAPITKQQWDEARAMVREQHQGSANARTPWILGAGAKWQAMSMNPIEMDFLNSRKFNREEICSVFGVPPVLLGSQDAATYNNIQTAKRIYWEDTVVPFLEDISDSLNLILIPYWDKESSRLGREANLRIRPDFSKVAALQQSLDDKVNAAKTLFGMGVPFNIINQRLELGFDPVPEGDLPRGGLTTIPGDTPNNGSKNRQTKSIWPEEEKAKFWKSFDSGRVSWEDRIAKEVSALFEEEGKAIANAYLNGNLDEAFKKINTDAWNGLIEAAYSSVIEHFATIEGRRLENEAKAGPGPLSTKFSFAKTTAIKKFIAKYTAEKVVQITTTTKDRIKEIVDRGLESGESADTISKNIRNLYKDWAQPADSEITLARAYLIARTEVGAAANYGLQEGARQISEQLGVTVVKTWISSRDERVRDSHAGIDGETASLDDPYSNGLMQPADPGGPPEETINCRCAEAHHVKL